MPLQSNGLSLMLNCLCATQLLGEMQGIAKDSQGQGVMCIIHCKSNNCYFSQPFYEVEPSTLETHKQHEHKTLDEKAMAQVSSILQEVSSILQEVF